MRRPLSRSRYRHADDVSRRSGLLGIVAEHDGQIVGSGFADQRSRIAGIGPISVDPETQNQGVGRTLTQAVVDHFTARDFPGIRLVQTAYHNRSLCLYTTIGFQTREPLSVMQGPSLNIKFVGHDVRPATEVDAPSLQSSSSASTRLRPWRRVERRDCCEDRDGR